MCLWVFTRRDCLPQPRLREELEVARETSGDKAQVTLKAMCKYARLLQEQNRLSEAEALFKEDVDARREVLGPRHPGTLLSLGHYATVLQLQGKLEEAEPICEMVRISSCYHSTHHG